MDDHVHKHGLVRIFSTNSNEPVRLAWVYGIFIDKRERDSLHS